MKSLTASPKLCSLCHSPNVSIEPCFFQSYPQGNGSALRHGYYYCQDCRGMFVWPVYTVEQITKHWRLVAYSDPVQNINFQALKSHLEIKLLKKLYKLAKGKRLLDYGCAFGNFMSKAKEQGFDVEGLDPNPQAIKSLNEKGFTSHHAWTMKELAFPSSCFDVIVALDSFCFTWDPYETLEEFYRVLSPSGILAMRISNKRLYIEAILRALKPGSKQEALLDRIVMKQFHSISLRLLKSILSKIGFQVIKLEGAPTAPFWKMQWPGRISYAIAEIAYILSLGKLVSHPGVLLIAHKVER